MSTEYEAHEAAAIFPLMTDAEFDGLLGDIQKNGQQNPIYLYEGKIIDGRNRYNACKQLGIQPIIKEWTGSGNMLDFIVSLNFHRRNLDESQRSMVGAKIKHIFEEDARKRQIALAGTRPSVDLSTNWDEGKEASKNGRASDKAAKLVNSSSTSIYRAAKVLKDGIPELIQSVEAGQVTVAKAHSIAKLPAEEQADILQRELSGEKVSRRKPKDATLMFTPRPRSDPPKGFSPDPEGSEMLYEILSRISETLGLLIGHAENELLRLPKSTVKEVRFRVGGCIDGMHKSAERLEISYKMCK